jgi:hypothetical protein
VLPIVPTHARHAHLATSSIMSDVIFDNIFTDMAFHGVSPRRSGADLHLHLLCADKIKTSARNVAAVQLNVRIARPCSA